MASMTQGTTRIKHVDRGIKYTQGPSRANYIIANHRVILVSPNFIPVLTEIIEYKNNLWWADTIKTIYYFCIFVYVPEQSSDSLFCNLITRPNKTFSCSENFSTIVMWWRQPQKDNSSRWTHLTIGTGYLHTASFVPFRTCSDVCF